MNLSVHMFETVDAMEVRHQFGTVLDKVLHGSKRFVIQRHGQAKALLVPLSDGEAISDLARQKTDKLEEAYAALRRLKGIVKDPQLANASGTIGDWNFPELPLEGNAA